MASFLLASELQLVQTPVSNGGFSVVKKNHRVGNRSGPAVATEIQKAQSNATRWTARIADLRRVRGPWSEGKV